MNAPKTTQMQDPLGLSIEHLPHIKNVWKYNLEKEFARLSKAVEEGYNWVAMDTEFPGIVFNYVMDSKNPEMGYRILKMNVDNLKLIQVGITVANEKGQKPAGTHTWQFNLNFNVNTEKYHPESITLLKEAGIVFEELIEHGIDPMCFGDILMSSGLVVNPDVTWIAFHGAYDFSYLLKVLINDLLPQTSDQYLIYLKHLFPNIYDIKTIINDIDEWKNLSLSRLGNDLDLKRTGHQHQAGSDALLTVEIFFAIYLSQFADGIPSKYFNKVFGISNDGNFNFSNYQSPEIIMPNFYQYPPYYQNYPYYNEHMYNPSMPNFYYPAQQMPEHYYMNVPQSAPQMPNTVPNPYQRN
jgi:CCR4-NOT transcription complex subunit 7/8